MYTFTGVSASPGIVMGPVEQIDHGTAGLHRIVCDPFRERALYDVAVVLAKDELRRLSQRAKGPDADISAVPDRPAGGRVLHQRDRRLHSCRCGRCCGRGAGRTDFCGPAQQRG